MRSCSRPIGHSDQAQKFLQTEAREAQAKGYAYFALQGEIASARLTQKTAPSAENALHLRTLGQQADRAGFKGLARSVQGKRGDE